MADPPIPNEPSTEEDLGPVMIRRPVEDSADLDITPMIDITFLLLIFFIVCSVAASQSAVDLPSAKFGKGVSEQLSVIFVVIGGTGTTPAEVYVDSTSGDRLPADPKTQETAIMERVEEGLGEGKTAVLIKAAKDVKHRDVSRVAAAAGLVEGMKLHLAVMEIE